MKKLKWFIFINVILLLIATLITVTKTDQLSRQASKIKLEQAINETPLEENVGDAQIVKDKIKNDVSNSKIINEDTNKFPVYTKVDGYDFKVEENGKVEDVYQVINNEDISNKQENNVNEADGNNENGSNKEENKEKEETMIKYKNETKEGKGITISTTKDGIVTINGKSTEKLFIKISNGINITDKIEKDFENWKEDKIILEKDKNIEEHITEVENIPIKGQLNVVLRTENNEAYAIIKLVNGDTNYIGVLEKNIIANYIYLDKDVELNNTKFKVEITEENNLENITNKNNTNI